MNHGVLFEVNGVQKHSLDDFGLWLNPLEIPYPEVKTKYVDLEMADGQIDLTESAGRIFYNNRTFPITFQCVDRLRFGETINELIAFLHGQQAKVTFWYEPEYYYFGRIVVNQYTSESGTGTIELEATFNPYKLKQFETVAVDDVTGEKTVIYQNDRMIVTPTFKASSAINFTFNGNDYALGTTETVFPDLEFKKGENIIQYTGTAQVTVTYQEGGL